MNSLETFSQLLGGIGLFLLGMLLLTDGLKEAAGEALRRVLLRLAGRPVPAFFSGLTLTALIQSSSATTLATIGFVSAGLLTFGQAIGIVIGGSVGTTATGWLVSLLGLKLSVGKLALPLIGIGALLRLVGRGRLAACGLALAGFGLIFVGIDALQAGMAGLAERVQPDTFPAATLGGRALLGLIGVVLTVIMQSSSAAIAMTITAFHAGSVNLEQALSLVIGASIGTTVTAALASIGGSVAARRTALAHILFNSFAGLIGFLVEPVFVLVVQHWELRGEPVSGALSLAAFHTSFTVLAAIIVLPGVQRLARVVTRLVPDRGPPLTRHLDDSLREAPEMAVEAVRRTLLECTAALAGDLKLRLGAGAVVDREVLAQVQVAARAARTFLSRVPPIPASPESPPRRLALFHALDHLDQLTAALHETAARHIAADHPHLESLRENLRQLLEQAAGLLAGTEQTAALAALATLAAEAANLRHAARAVILDETARGGLTPERAEVLLETIRFWDFSAQRLWRIFHHLTGAEAALNGTPAAEAVSAGQG